MEKQIYYPKVSIVIPVYNGANYMREAINSALAQTYPNVEVVVVNDGSRDGSATERIALSYGNRIRYFSKENGGVATALNLGIEKMTGEYFSWLSHDDMYTPDKIEKQIEALKKADQYTIAYSDFCTISPSGKMLDIYQVSPKGMHSMKGLLAIGTENSIHGCTLLIPRVLFERFGLFNPKLRYTQDFDVWFRFAGNVSFIHVKETLVLSRQHEEQDSKKKPIECTIEADRLHSRLIGSMSDDEVDRYCEKSVDYLIAAFNLYKNAGYEKTSFKLLKHISRLAEQLREDAKAITLINDSILMSEIPKKAKEFWEEQILPLSTRSDNKKRILVYTNVWFRGGVERVVANILNKLSHKYTWILVSSDKELEGGFELEDQITHIKLCDVAPDKIASRIAALSVLLDIDLFIGHPNIIYHFLKVYELLRELNIKTIACNHGYYFLPYHYNWLHPVIERRFEAYKNADAVTWLTSFSANIYSQLADNSVLMPNPNTFPKKKISNPITNKKVILSVGRFYDEVKRLDRVLEVFARVLPQHPDCALVLVGGYDLDMHIPADSKESIRDILKRISIPEANITFAGEQSDVEKYYSNACLLMLTSESEGFSMVLTEAGTYGLPCVIFDIPGLEDVISDGENGFIVPQDDLNLMASRINKLLSEPDLLREMGLRAKELVDRFEQEKICNRWEQLIDTVMKNNDREVINELLRRNFLGPVQNNQNFIRRLSNEYQKNIAIMLKNAKNPVIQTIAISENKEVNPNDYLNEIHQSLSWRITKPLRWSKKLFISLRDNGIKITVQKVKIKVANKLRA